jgi:glucose-1-phosphate adenylyltransferase
LYDSDWPIWTYQEQLPPAKFVFNNEGRRGAATDSLVSGGCIISGSNINRSVLFSNVRVHSFSSIEDSVILPQVEIGRNVKLKRVVIDKGAVIPDGMKIGFDLELDRKRFHVSEKGITLVTAAMLGTPTHRIR